MKFCSCNRKICLRDKTSARTVKDLLDLPSEPPESSEKIRSRNETTAKSPENAENGIIILLMQLKISSRNILKIRLKILKFLIILLAVDLRPSKNI